MAKGKQIIRGLPGSPGVAVVTVRIVDKDIEKMAVVKPGEALVGERFEPEHDEYIEKASALVTDVGGKLSHAAVAAKTYGIPAVVGTVEGSTKLKDGDMVIVDGNEGVVYEYIPEAEPAPPASLADKMAQLAAKKGITIDPEFLEKMRKRG